MAASVKRGMALRQKIRISRGRMSFSRSGSSVRTVVEKKAFLSMIMSFIVLGMAGQEVGVILPAGRVMGNRRIIL